MRFVVLGAGAIGGSVGALLARASVDVVLIARGPHGDAIRERGLRLDTPEETFVVHAPVTRTPAWREDDVVLLAVKTQDAELAIRDIPPQLPIVCLTNGIAAERIAARHSQSVYGAYVFVGGSHLEPGSVQLWSSPIAGVIDVGAYPHGAGELAGTVSSMLQRAGFASVVREDIMRYKRGKLLLNLLNVAEALCGPFDDELEEIEERARAEAIACFEAASLDYTIDQTRFVGVKQIGGTSRPGGSTWQSLTRGRALETDFLNGEIVALGRAHGIPTPTNVVLQRLGADAVAHGSAPGSLSLEALIAAVKTEQRSIAVSVRSPN
jgi:2-dehydropantoate 2-reductase